MAKDNWTPRLSLALGLALASPVWAQGGNDLATCLSIAESAPEAGLAKAKDWEERGGADRAKLCQAMALFHAGQFKEAASRLETLVPTLGRDDPKGAATLLSRAGWAWLRAGQAAKAEELYTQALERLPEDVDILIDRAIARAEQERYWDVVNDLTTAIARAPQRADAYLYRAGAYRHLGSLELAKRDVAQVLELKPDDPEALVLRGTIRLMGGDAKGARADWSQVAKQAPGTPEGRDAEANLARLGKVQR